MPPASTIARLGGWKQEFGSLLPPFKQLWWGNTGALCVKTVKGLDEEGGWIALVGSPCGVNVRRRCTVFCRILRNCAHAINLGGFLQGTTIPVTCNQIVFRRQFEALKSTTTATAQSSNILRLSSVSFKVSVVVNLDRPGDGATFGRAPGDLEGRHPERELSPVCSFCARTSVMGGTSGVPHGVTRPLTYPDKSVEAFSLSLELYPHTQNSPARAVKIG